jgi:hypothetical protein
VKKESKKGKWTSKTYGLKETLLKSKWVNANEIHCAITAEEEKFDAMFVVMKV